MYIELRISLVLAVAIPPVLVYTYLEFHTNYKRFRTMMVYIIQNVSVM